MCVIYRVTQKNVHHQKWNNYDNFSQIDKTNLPHEVKSMWKHLQSFMSVPQKLFVKLELQKCAKKRATRCCKHIWIGRIKFSMTLRHYSFGIAFIAAVIATFRSEIVWGLLLYTLFLEYLHRFQI